MDNNNGAAYKVNDAASLDALLNNPGGTPPQDPPADGTQPPADGAPPQDSPAGDQPPNTDPGKGDDGKQDPPPDDKQKQEAEAKTHQAFAAMRTQIKEQTQILSNIAKALDISYDNEADMIAKIKDLALDKISAKSQVPKDILQRLEASEAIAAEKRAADRYNANLDSLNRIMTQFAMPKDVVVAFANELLSEGIEWATTDKDLVSEFKVRKLDLIIEKATKKAEQDALLRQQAANNNSSKSKDAGSKQGGPGTTVNTMADLDNLLKTMGK